MVLTEQRRELAADASRDPCLEACRDDALHSAKKDDAIVCERTLVTKKGKAAHHIQEQRGSHKWGSGSERGGGGGGSGGSVGRWGSVGGQRPSIGGGGRRRAAAAAADRGGDKDVEDDNDAERQHTDWRHATLRRTAGGDHVSLLTAGW
jgi:hypothetical protein